MKNGFWWYPNVQRPTTTTKQRIEETQKDHVVFDLIRPRLFFLPTGSRGGREAEQRNKSKCVEIKRRLKHTHKKKRIGKRHGTKKCTHKLKNKSKTREEEEENKKTEQKINKLIKHVRTARSQPQRFYFFFFHRGKSTLVTPVPVLMGLKIFHGSFFFFPWRLPSLRLVSDRKDKSVHTHERVLFSERYLSWFFFCLLPHFQFERDQQVFLSRTVPWHSRGTKT